MRKLLILLAAIGFYHVMLGQGSYKALFVGNSYTYVNDLPALLRAMTLAGGDTLATEQSAPGGATFQGHSQNATTLNFLNQPGFDFLILQEQSQRPSFPQSQVQQEVYPYATQLDTIFHNANPCGQTVFYMTWGRKNGDAQNCAFWTPVCTYAGMQYELRRSYLNMANQNQALVAPVGIAWWEAIMRDTTLELYQPDESHPALAGSYLAACTFYATMYRRTPVGNTYYAGLDSTTATFLQNVAHDVVFDSLTQWRIGLDDVAAGFQHNATGATVAFTDQSQNALTWHWDFGDGNTSTQPAPQHTYTQSGTYTVTQTVSDGCDTAVFTDTVTVVVVSLDQSAAIHIYPNPTHGPLHLIDLPHGTTLNLYDLQGKHVQRFVMDESGLIDLGGMRPGVYLLSGTLEGSKFQMKVVVTD